MIFQTQDQSRWHRWFAWFPVDIGGHRVAWLETVERQWNPEAWAMADFSGWSCEVGGYVYRQRLNEGTVTAPATAPSLAARDTGAGGTRNTECSHCDGNGYTMDLLGGCGDPECCGGPVKVKCLNCTNDWQPE